MKLRLAFIFAAFFAIAAPAGAQDIGDDAVANTPPVTPALRGLAPADEYFGRYNLSVLGIANNIRDAGSRIDHGADVHAMIEGPLAYATDAIHAWEDQYPSDPWIAKDLLALETAYLKIPNDECLRLARRTEAWLRQDFPDTAYAAQGRKQLADATAQPSAQERQLVQQPVYAQAPVYIQQPVIVQQPVYVQQPVVVRGIPSYATPWERYAVMRPYYGR